MGDAEEPKRGPGRPRKWADNAERMRAYRAKVAHERNVIKAGGTYTEMAEQIAELTRQRDANWAQVGRLQEQIKAMKRDQPGRRSTPSRSSFDDPDEAAEAQFAAVSDAGRPGAGHAECDAEIDRLENELVASGRQRADLAATVRRLEEQNTELASQLIAATNSPSSKSAAAGQPAMSRAQRRAAERQAKRKQRRS